MSAGRKTDGDPGGFRASPEFFWSAIESLSEYALITIGRDLKITSWSGPACAMFGYSQSEILGRGISVLFTPEDIAGGLVEREFEQAFEKGRMDDERWHVRSDGQRLWCYGLSFPLKDESGDMQGYVKLIRDDTERKRKDDLLRENEERLSLAGESTGLGTWDYDVARRTLILSRRASYLFGLGDKPQAQGFEQFAQMVHPEDRRRISKEFDACVAAGGASESDLVYRIRMPDGGIRWVRTLARAFFEQGARESAPARLIGTVVDVTEARAARERELDVNRELEARVRERTASLVALNKELETFAYSASHDLRAPLRQIAAFSQAILLSRESRLSPADQKHFERIRAAAEKMQVLVNGMLSLSRATRQPLSESECDLGAIVRGIAEELRKSAPNRDVSFVIADDVRARGDPELLRAALQNLIENAWKFTSRRRRALIEFGVTQAGGQPVYFIKDNGVGFDMRFAEQLFRAFRRLHADREFPGTGVGLGIVERVVRRHRGRIWADAKVGEGATFFFTLHSEEERA